MFVTSCCPAPGTPVFLELTGPQSSRVALMGNDLSGADRAVVEGDDVPADATRRQ